MSSLNYEPCPNGGWWDEERGSCIIPILGAPPIVTPAVSGTRFDKNKAKLHLIPPIIEIGLVPVYEHGAAEYGDYNWLENPMNWSRMYDSLQRHAKKFWSGSDVDIKSKLLHTQHLAWNAAGLMAYQLLNIGVDDRFKRYPLEEKDQAEELG